MTGYKDMTFCDGNDGKCYAFKYCRRAITAKVRAGGKAWWGSEDFPIAVFGQPKELKCYNKGE